MGILGDFGKTIASAAPALDRLIAAAELHHAFSFDPIGHGVTRLDYEPRCSASCAEPDCQAIWVGSKAGEVFHLRFGADEPTSTKSWVDRSVRALVHVHRLGMLIAGTDHGHLVLFGGELVKPRYIHVESWFERQGTQPCLYHPGHPIDGDEDPFNDGITAILELPADNPAVVDIVVATRYPALYVVRLQRDALAVRARHLLPGWTQCLTTLGPPGDEILVCASRGGELLEWRCRALRDDPAAAPVPTLTNLLPNAIGKRSGQLPEQQTTLLIGATDGLYMCRTGAETPAAARPVQLAATRSAVLSIAVVTIRSPRASEPVTYVALGLEDGRLRVIEERALFGALHGREALQAHDFPVVLGDAVLALEVLASDDPTACFVFAALRDHRVRLYRVRSREALCEELDALWRTAIDEPTVIPPAALDGLLVREAELRRSIGSKHENALRYWLADEVLPRWTPSGAHDERVVARACEIAKGADEKVLYRLSARIGDIGGTDVDALIRLSMACLVAMPERDARRWRAFVSYHLKQFHACVRRVVDHADLSRLQYWGRFVRKYLLLGETFADKRYRIESLMKRNRETRKYLDALIYAAQLERQRYDLKWSQIACQDEDGRDQEIARVDLIDDCAIVVTASAEVVFFNVEGERLPIFSSQGGLDRLVPLRGDGASGLIRTRAARVVRRDRTWVRIALSWAGASALAPHQLRVTIFDLRLTRSGVEVEGVHVATTSQPRRSGGIELEVHGLVGLPNQDAFLVGFDSSESPLALLKLEVGPDGPTWVLSLLEMSRAPGSPDALPAVLSTPVRAVAAIALDAARGRYLAAAGAADGALRFAEFDLGGNVTALDVQPMLFVYPINDIALAPRDGDSEYSHVCYAGTETGVCFCLLVGLSTAEGGRREIVATQLWRDLHRGPVVAVRPWSDTRKDDLYNEPVVFVATQTGNLSIYHAGHGAQVEPRIHGSGNYRVEGMRFDRIDLPPGLTSWAIRQGRSAFLAAYPSGRLLFGELYGPRESTVRGDLLSKLDELYGEVNLARPFFGDRARETDKLEICAMIRIGDGALRSYILRKQLEQRAWDSFGDADIDALLADYLDRLSPEVVEERDQIKIVIEVVTSHVLGRRPAEILEDCRPGRSYDKVARYGRVVRTCERLKRYLLDEAVQAQPGVVRVRMVIMAALFRANVFSYLPVDEHSGRRIQAALREVLTACLRDDDRIVRIEALRAVAAALRNIRVLFDQADDDAHLEELRASFFPRGLKAIQWLIDALLENFARYRRHGEPVLLSTAWSYTTVLVAMIGLFPGDALELCDQISRWGLGDNLEILAERLRGRHIESVRWRIRELCVVPSVRQQAQARDEFIKAFGDCQVGQTLAEHKIAPSDADYIRASDLLHAYRRLALLWKVNHQADIADIQLRWIRAGELPEMTGSLVSVRRSLEALVDIARAGFDERAARLRELRSQIASGWRDGHKPPDAVRFVLERVIERWQAVVEPKIPTPGEKLGSHILGSLITVRGNGLVYALEGDPTRVMKVLRDPRDVAARQEFNRDARLSRELAERYPASFVSVYSLEPTSGYAVIDSFKAVGELHPARRAPLAAIAASQLARALRCLHEEDLAHGDLRAANVFVNEGSEPAVRLGDLHAVTSDGGWSSVAHQIPRILQEPAGGTKLAHWIDLVSLTLVLAWMATGETLDQDADDRALDQLASSLKTPGLTGGDAIARALAHLRRRLPISAERLEWLLAPGKPPGFERKPLAGRPLARFDVFISYNSQDIAVARALYTGLVARGLVPYLDEREAVSDRWRLDIRNDMDECRAFAILIGSKYRTDAPQHKEVMVALEESQNHNLPFKMFLLGSERPTEFQAVLQDHPVIQVGENVRLMTEEIIRSFQHPIARLGHDAVVRDAAGTSVERA